MDEFEKPELTRKEQKYLKKVQGVIEYCEYCQPYDEGEVVWIHGDPRDLMDIFYEYDVPEESWENITSHLVCRYCSCTSFDIGSTVGVKTKFEYEVDKHMDEVYGLYGSDVRNLESLLEKYPMLAYKDKFAKRIYKEIKDKTLPTTSVNGKYYRARKVESSEIINSKGMHNPPLGKPTEGRFNHSGQSHLYLANSKVAAIKEVASKESGLLVWVQEFELPDSVNDLLDLSFDWSHLTPTTSLLLLSLKVYDSIGRSDRNKDNWRPDYYLTRYIMDCAKSLGYNGIKYNSTKDSSSYDLVLFYPKRIKLVAIGPPTIEIFSNNNDDDELPNDEFDSIFEN